MVESQRSRLRRRSTTNRPQPAVLRAPSPILPQKPKRGSILPPWDRAVDVVYHEYRNDEKRPERPTVSQESVERFFFENGRARDTTGYFHLPHNVRFLICQYVMCDDPKTTLPVTLNGPCFNKDCWEPSDFVPLQDALYPFQRYLRVSFGFYADMLLLFLAKHTFHVVFSPYLRSTLHPIATTWLNKYAPYMRNIIVEIDLTKLAFGPELCAARLLPSMGYLNLLLHNFTESLLRREESSPLNSMILLCRRFFGERGEAEVQDSSSLRACSRASSFRVQSLDSGMTKFSLEQVKEVDEHDEDGVAAMYHEDSKVYHGTEGDKNTSFNEIYDGEEVGAGQAVYADEDVFEDSGFSQDEFPPASGETKWFADITKPTGPELSALMESLFKNHHPETGYPKEDYALLLFAMSQAAAQRSPGAIEDGYTLVPSATTNEATEISDASSTCISISSTHSSQLQFTEYCPDEYLHVCNYLLRLSGHVDSARLCGFSEGYTHDFIVRLFPGACFRSARDHCYRVAPSTLWPRLQGQRSWVDVGYGQLVLDNHEVPMGIGTVPRGPIQLPMPGTDSGATTFVSTTSDFYSLPISPAVRSCTSLSGRKTSHSAASTDVFGGNQSIDSDGKSVVQRFLERCKPRDKSTRTLLRKASATL